MSDSFKHWLDMIAAAIALAGTVATTTVTFLASGLAVVWYIIRIYEWWKDKDDHI